MTQTLMNDYNILSHDLLVAEDQLKALQKLRKEIIVSPDKKQEVYKLEALGVGLDNVYQWNFNPYTFQHSVTYEKDVDTAIKNIDIRIKELDNKVHSLKITLQHLREDLRSFFSQ